VVKEYPWLQVHWDREFNELFSLHDRHIVEDSHEMHSDGQGWQLFEDDEKYSEDEHGIH
jgi:hypothetical protein